MIFKQSVFVIKLKLITAFIRDENTVIICGKIQKYKERQPQKRGSSPGCPGILGGCNMTGLTSVTFRGLNVETIVELAVQAGIDGIEWGGDIHVPEGDLEAAGYASGLTKSAGLKVLSYGSYYRLGNGGDFSVILKTARELEAPNIRIWAGSISPEAAGEEDYKGMAEELKQICSQAQKEGITISLEYHRGTLTETAVSTLKLIGLVQSKNLYTYWQPNPDITPDKNCEELKRIKPYLSHIHTFYWKAGNIRYPLAEGRAEWLNYLRAAELDLKKSAYILEFVKDDSINNFMADAAELKNCLLAL